MGYQMQRICRLTQYINSRKWPHFIAWGGLHRWNCGQHDFFCSSCRNISQTYSFSGRKILLGKCGHAALWLLRACYCTYYEYSYSLWRCTVSLAFLNIIFLVKGKGVHTVQAVQLLYCCIFHLLHLQYHPGRRARLLQNVRATRSRACLLRPNGSKISKNGNDVKVINSNI